MLPGPVDGAVRLADVLRDSLTAVAGEPIAGEPPRLPLPSVDRAAVIVVDGLGAENLRARAGHARTLVGAMRERAAVIDSGAPTTTAAALASLTTGTGPGRHGIVGYTALEPESQRVVNQLHGFDHGELPPGWQRERTLFERARQLGLEARVYGAEQYRTSGFTREVLRGADYTGGRRIEDRVEALAAGLADRRWRGIAYGYLAELDSAGHESGSASDDWAAALERVDAAMTGLARSLGPEVGVLITADHGMVDLAPHQRLVVPDDSPLWRGVRHVAGEHRLLHLHAEAGIDPSELAARWVEAEGARAWVATRDEAIERGWFGPVAEVVRPRIGDVLVAPRKQVAYYTEAAFAGKAGRMVGQHGSWTPAETRVPLLRFGAFA